MEGVGEEEELGPGPLQAEELDSSLGLAAPNCETLGEPSSGQVFISSSTDIQTLRRANLGSQMPSTGQGMDAAWTWAVHGLGNQADGPEVQARKGEALRQQQ